jgi:hypothetical protein
VIRFSIIVASLVAPFANAQAPIWDGRSLPITIEVLRDVPVKASERRADGSYGQERGSLYSSTAFRISRGQRFKMVEALGEGSCRIAFQGSEYVLSSCPWVPGFTDNQADIFSVVEFQNR